MTPIGKPPPNTFPYVDISDVSLNSFWTLEHLSLKPVIISSRINKILFFLQKELKDFKYSKFSSVGRHPCIGSKKTHDNCDFFLLSISIVFLILL